MLKKIIDFHTHVGISSDASQTIDQILQNMLTYGISQSVVFPINQKLSTPQYSALHEEISKAVKKNPGKLTGFLRPIASDRESAVKELDLFDQYGFSGIKLHPLSDGSTPEASMFIAEFASHKGIPIIVHTAHNKHCTPLDWQPVAKAFPNLNIVLAHSGRSLIEQAIEVARECDNVYFDTSINIYFNLRMAAAALPADRFLFGSDTPYSHLEIDLLKVQLLWSGADLEKVTLTNAQRLLSYSYD